MMFTTTISVISMYSTSTVVIVPIIWLYITAVVVVISFSIIVQCSFISLLLIFYGIRYVRVLFTHTHSASITEIHMAVKFPAK